MTAPYSPSYVNDGIAAPGNLSYAHKRWAAGYPLTVVFTGDSTTLCSGQGSNGLVPIFAAMASALGIPVNVVNRGQAGMTAHDWITTYLSGDLAANPDILIPRWGINDGIAGRSVSDYIADINSGLDTIRAAKAVDALTVPLCTPNAFYYDATHNEAWGEAIYPGLVSAAINHQCAFVDIYALARDARNGSDWLDTIKVHPQAVANRWFADKLIDTLFPRATAAKIAAASNRFYDGSVASPAGTTSGSFVQMGMGALATKPWVLTPRGSGVVSIRMSAMGYGTVAGTAGQYCMSYGTGTPPAAGVALTGTPINGNEQAFLDATGNGTECVDFIGEISGLTPGVPYWFDPYIKRAAGTGEAKIYNIVISIAEQK